MLTMNQTVGKDKDAIWVVRINLDAGGYLYFADVNDKVTLSSIDFDGKVIFKDSLSEIEKLVDVTQGGSIGQVGNFGFAVARHTSYTGVSNFFNDFYPATSKPLLTSKTIEVGIVWSGATLTSQITWFAQYYIEDYSFQTNRMDAFCIEYDELSGRELPPFVVQKEFDDGISYYSEAPDESYGSTIPIVYGDFSTVNLEYSQFNLAPTLRVHKRDNKYLASCHILHTKYLINSLFRYLQGAETVMWLFGTTTSAGNTRAGHYIQLDSNGSYIYGQLYLQPKVYTDYYNPDGDSWTYTEGGTNKEYAFDDDSTTYCELAPNREFAVKLGSNLTESELGILSTYNYPTNQDYIQMVVLYDTTDAANPIVKYYHPTMGVNSGYSPLSADPGSVNGTGLKIEYNFANGSGIENDTAGDNIPTNWDADPKKHSPGVPWTIDELQQLQFHVQNKNTSTGNLRIKNIYFIFQYIAVSGTKNIIFVPTGLLDQYIAAKTGKYRTGQESFKGELNTNIFAYAKGMMFDYWVD